MKVFLFDNVKIIKSSYELKDLSIKIILYE